MNIIYILQVITILIYLLIKIRKYFQMLQQNWYNEDNRYIKWIIKNKPFEIREVLGYIFIVLNNYNEYAFFAVFIYLFTIMYLKKENVKIALKYTKRIIRLYITTIILFLAVLLFKNYYIIGAIYAAFIILLPILVQIINIINIPLEKLVYLYYKNNAISKLNNYKYMEVIGITGSYGKTSTKNLVNAVLNSKYNSFKTPKNFNTAYGLINTINNFLDKFNDYFIAEMGASNIGDIDKICKIVKPKYGIITKIGCAHLDSFKSIDNILKTKFELAESILEDGFVILNYDDKLQRDYKFKNNVKTYFISIDNKKSDLYATNIKLNSDGVNFDCIYKKKTYNFSMRLLGKFNIYNALSAILLGLLLDIEIELIQDAISNVEAVSHRLELKQYGSITLIDDAYNSNPDGAKMALDVLESMDADTRIVVTPGMVDLGLEQDKLNENFGVQMASACDYAILVGEKQTQAIKKGLLKRKFKEKNIFVIEDVKEAFTLMKKLENGKTYVLLENDLPDIFNER